MQFQVSNTPSGYVVEVYVFDEGRYRFRPLMNFGDSQGDARMAAFEDFPKMEPSRIVGFARMYERSKVYRRVRAGSYRRV